MELTPIITAIKKCQKSANPKAFKVLYDNYSGQVYGVCLRYVRNESDAQDILQETFIAAFYKIENYQFKGPFGAWVTRIAVNNCLQKLRQNKKNIIIVQDFDEPEGNGMSYTVNISDESEFEMNLGQRLMDLLDHFPLGYKTILNLFIVEGYSHKEIAQALEISESTSRSQLTRAKEALRKVLKNQDLKTEIYD